MECKRIEYRLIDLMTDKQASRQRAVWRQAGCVLRGHFSGNLEVHRPSQP